MQETSRRDFIRMSAGAAAGLAALGGAPLTNAQRANAQTERKMPNLLIIHTDQLSQWALSIYAANLTTTPNYGKVLVQTPNIDRIGREGAVLTHFFTNSAVCTPSRGCFFTGRYPESHGAHVNNVPLNRDEITIARLLKQNGYETGYCGKWHLDGPPKPGFMTPDRSMGFDDCHYMFNRGHWKEIDEDKNGNPSVTTYSKIGNDRTYTTDYLANKTIEFITRNRSKPFLYVVSFPDPHGPITVREPYMSMYKPADMPLPHSYNPKGDVAADKEDGEGGGNVEKETKKGRKVKKSGKGEDQVRSMKAHYCGEVKCIDDNVGRILSALEKKGALDNTIVVFSTDHGEYMAEHNLFGKNQWYRTAYRIPFLIRWPEKIKPNTVIGHFASNVDLQQTLCGLIGVKPCGREQGRDFSPLLRGEKNNWEDVAWIHHSSLQGAGLYTPKYDLILKQSGANMLFDLESDPEQMKNLASDPARTQVFDDMKRRIIEHHRQLKTPELKWLDAASAATMVNSTSRSEASGPAKPDEDGVVFRQASVEGSTLEEASSAVSKNERKRGATGKEGNQKSGAVGKEARQKGGGGFTRLLTTPEGLLAPNHEYLVSFDYVSRGLDGADSAFYYTIRPGADRDRTKQIGPIKWTAAKGESGHKEHKFATDSQTNWNFLAGIFQKGSLEIRNLTIKQMK